MAILINGDAWIFFVDLDLLINPLLDVQHGITLQKCIVVLLGDLSGKFVFCLLHGMKSKEIIMKNKPQTLSQNSSHHPQDTQDQHIFLLKIYTVGVYIFQHYQGWQYQWMILQLNYNF